MFTELNGIHSRWRTESGNRTNAVTGLPTSVSSSDDTVQVRLGAEYLFIFPRTVVPIRGGVFYDRNLPKTTPMTSGGFHWAAAFQSVILFLIVLTSFVPAEVWKVMSCSISDWNGC